MRKQEEERGGFVSPTAKRLKVDGGATPGSGPAGAPLEKASEEENSKLYESILEQLSGEGADGVATVPVVLRPSSGIACRKEFEVEVPETTTFGAISFGLDLADVLGGEALGPVSGRAAAGGEVALDEAGTLADAPEEIRSPGGAVLLYFCPYAS